MEDSGVLIRRNWSVVRWCQLIAVLLGVIGVLCLYILSCVVDRDSALNIYVGTADMYVFLPIAAVALKLGLPWDLRGDCSLKDLIELLVVILLYGAAMFALGTAVGLFLRDYKRKSKET
jgi:hypothetical protein